MRCTAYLQQAPRQLWLLRTVQQPRGAFMVHKLQGWVHLHGRHIACLHAAWVAVAAVATKPTHASHTTKVITLQTHSTAQHETA
jgi:hypothetical protein